MRYILKLAYANIMREKRRTILTMITLAIGLFFYIFVVSYTSGIQEKQLENIIEFETSHFKIRSILYNREEHYKLDNYLYDYKEVEEILSKKNFIKSYTERIEFLAEIDNGKNIVAVNVIGIDNIKDEKVFSLKKYITEGELKKEGIIIGKSLANELGVLVGDFVYLTFRTKGGMIDSLEYEVSGIINAPDININTGTALINIEEAKKALNIDAVLEIAVLTDNHKRVDNYIEEIKKDNNSVLYFSWRQLGETYIKFAQADAISGYIFSFFIVIIAVIGIINTMMMSVLEKKREIGTLKSLGMSDGEILLLFVTEGFWIGFIAAIFGTIIGCLVNWYFVIYGIDMTALFGENIDIGYKVSGIIKAKWNILGIFFGFVGSIIISMLSSFIPAKQTLIMTPVECLKSN